MSKRVWLTALIASLAAILIVWHSREADPDLFARVAVGRLVIRDFAPPAHDPFAFTPKKELWIDHEWLSGVIFYLTTNYFGDCGIFILRAIIICLTFLIITLAMNVSGKLMPEILLLSVPLITYTWGSPLRAQVFTYLALSLLYYLILVSERQDRAPKIYSLFCLFLLWSNLHGGVVAGVIIFTSYVGLRVLSNRVARKEWLIALLAGYAGAALSPYGTFTYWSYLIQAVSMPRPSIGEWNHLDLDSFSNVIWLLWIVFVSFGFSSKITRLNFAHLGVFIISVLAGLKAERLVAIAVITGLTLCADCTAASSKNLAMRLGRFGLPLRRSFISVSLVALLSASVINLNFLSDHFTTKLTYNTYPVAALNWLHANQPGGKLLNDFNNGSYALWRLYPDFLISFDGRYETVYLDQTLELNSCAMNPRCTNWSTALSEISPDYILLVAGQYPLWVKSGFSLIYSDPNFVILAKAESPLKPQRRVLDGWESNF